ncbi:MAG: ribonuclease R, partial [Deltaproteobacteria bacterium CG11_big_fil_rev_8_21_14_0_20_45_16]
FHQSVHDRIFIENSEIQKFDCDLHTIVRVELRRQRGCQLSARIVEVLPSIDSPETELQILAERHGFPTQFSARCINSSQNPNPLPTKHRQDLRQHNFVTIDGEDAKDFDDAICVEKQKDGSFYLFVSIADVSAFVHERSAIEEGAYERGTSIYFPGFAIPMLPESLSNDACSLVPNQERLCLTNLIKISKDGEIIQSQIFPSRIQSKARLTYNRVFESIFKSNPKQEDPTTLRMLEAGFELFDILVKRRKSLGSIELELPETKIEVDKWGAVKSIKPLHRNKAHMLIEQFMILSNEMVSEAIEAKGYPSIYRVHESPDPEKLQRFMMIMKALGIDKSKELRAPIRASQVQNLKRVFDNHPQADLLNMALLRSFKQANYSASNVGHFGLASPSYCHFTSPIRRYPDLTIHRILRNSLFLTEKRPPFRFEQLEKIAMESSEREQRANLAERDMEDFKKSRFMEGKEGNEYDAVIVNVKEFGFFVQLLDPCVEGLVPMRTLPNDYWQIDEHEFELQGRKSHRGFRLGDRIKVQLMEVNRYKAQLSFRYVSHL